jgi:hypothetical protein
LEKVRAIKKKSAGIIKTWLFNEGKRVHIRFKKVKCWPFLSWKPLYLNAGQICEKRMQVFS